MYVSTNEVVVLRECEHEYLSKGCGRVESVCMCQMRVVAVRVVALRVWLC